MGKELGVVVRPWGVYEVLAKEDDYWIKILRIKEGHRTSLQSHKDRKEYWTVLYGKGTVEKEDWDGNYDTFYLETGHMLAIGKEIKHRITATGEQGLVLCEVALGRPDENDIERFEDDYGRTK